MWSQRSSGGRKRDSHEKQYDDRFVVHKHVDESTSKDVAVCGFSPLGSEHSHRSAVKHRSSRSKSPLSGRKDKDRGSRRGTTPPTPTDDDFPLGGKVGTSHAGVDPKEVKHKLLKISKHDGDAKNEIQMQDVSNNVDVKVAAGSAHRSLVDVRNQLVKPRKRPLEEANSVAKKPCVRDRAAISLKVEEYISRQKKAFEKKKLSGGDLLSRSDKVNNLGDELALLKQGDSLRSERLEQRLKDIDVKHMPSSRGEGAVRACNVTSPSSKTSSEPDSFVERESVSGSDVLNLEKEKMHLLSLLEQLDDTGSVSDEQVVSAASLEHVSRHLNKPKLDGAGQDSLLGVKVRSEGVKLPAGVVVDIASQSASQMVAMLSQSELLKHPDRSKFQPIDATQSFRKQMEARRRVEDLDTPEATPTDSSKREQTRAVSKFNPPPPLKHIECCDDEQVPVSEEYTSLAEVPAEFKSKKRRKTTMQEIDTFTKNKRSYRNRNSNSLVSSGDEGDELDEKAELAAKQEKVLEDIVTLLTEQKHRDQPGKSELKSPHGSRRESKNPPRIIPDSVVVGGAVSGDGRTESNVPQEPRKMPRGRRKGSPMSLPLPRFAFETCWSPRQSPKDSVKSSELTASPKERSPLCSKINSPSFSPGRQPSPTLAPQKMLSSAPQPPSPSVTPPLSWDIDAPLKSHDCQELQHSSIEDVPVEQSDDAMWPLIIDTGQPTDVVPQLATQLPEVVSLLPVPNVAVPVQLIATAPVQEEESKVCELPAMSLPAVECRIETNDSSLEVKPATPEEPPMQLAVESEPAPEVAVTLPEDVVDREALSDVVTNPKSDDDTNLENDDGRAGLDTLDETPPPPPPPPHVLSPKLDSSDTDLSELGSPNQQSLEEQIRALDEKLSITAAAAHAIKMPDTSALSLSDYRERFRIKRRTDAPLSTMIVPMANKPEPSDIAKSLLARNSIFDQDSKRLRQISEKYEFRGMRGTSVDEQSRTSMNVAGLEYEALTTPGFGAIGRQSSAPGSTMPHIMSMSLVPPVPKSAPPASSVGDSGFGFSGRTLGSPRIIAASSNASDHPVPNDASDARSSQQNPSSLPSFSVGSAKPRLSPPVEPQAGKLVIDMSPVSQTVTSATVTNVTQKPAQLPVRPCEPVTVRSKPVVSHATSNAIPIRTDNVPPSVSTDVVVPCLSTDVSKQKEHKEPPSSVSSVQRKSMKDSSESSSHTAKDVTLTPKHKTSDEHSNIDKTKSRAKDLSDTTKPAQKSAAKSELAVTTKSEAKNESASSKAVGEPATKRPKLQTDKKDKRHGSVSKLSTEKDDTSGVGSSSNSKKCVLTSLTASTANKTGSVVKCSKTVTKDNTKRSDDKDRSREHGTHVDKSKSHGNGSVRDKQQKSRDDGGHDIVRQDPSGKEKRHGKVKERAEKDISKPDRNENRKPSSSDCKESVKSTDTGDVTKLDRTDRSVIESLHSDKTEHEDRTVTKCDAGVVSRDQHKSDKPLKVEKRESKIKDRSSEGKHSKTSDGKPSKDRTREQHSGHDGKPKSKLNNKALDKQKSRSSKPVDSVKDSRSSKDKCPKERSDRDRERSKGEKVASKDREHSGGATVKRSVDKTAETRVKGSAKEDRGDRSHHRVDDEKRATSNPSEKVAERTVEKSSKVSSSRTYDNRTEKLIKTSRSEKPSKLSSLSGHSSAADGARTSAGGGTNVGGASTGVGGASTNAGGSSASGADGRNKHGDRRPSGAKDSRPAKSRAKDEKDDKSRAKDEKDDKSRAKDDRDDKSRAEDEKDDKSRAKDEKDDKSRAKDEKDDKSRTKDEKDDKSRDEKDDKSRAKDEKDDKSREKDDKSRAKDEKDDKSRAKDEKDDKSRAKDDRSRAKDDRDDKSRSKDDRDDKSRSKDDRDDKSRSKDDRDDKSRSKDDRDDKSRSKDDRDDKSRSKDDRDDKSRSRDDRDDKSRSRDDRDDKSRSKDDRDDKSRSKDDRDDKSRSKDDRDDKSRSKDDRDDKSRSKDDRDDKSRSKDDRDDKSRSKDDRDDKSRSSRDSKQDKKSSSLSAQHQDKPQKRVRRESKSLDESRELKQLHAEMGEEKFDEWNFCSMYDRLKRRSNKEKQEDIENRKLAQVNEIY